METTCAISQAVRMNMPQGLSFIAIYGGGPYSGQGLLLFLQKKMRKTNRSPDAAKFKAAAAVSDSINDFDKAIDDLRDSKIFDQAKSIGGNITEIATEATEVSNKISKTLLSSINDVVQEFLSAVDVIVKEVNSGLLDIASAVDPSH